MTLPKNGLPDWAALVFVVGSDGKTVLVFDPAKNDPKWKVPGGKREKHIDETAEDTAVRELHEETGIKVFTDDLRLIVEVDKSRHKNPHTLFVFQAHVDTFDGLIRIGDEGEYVALYDIDDIPTMGDFFPPHLEHLRNVLPK